MTGPVKTKRPNKPPAAGQSGIIRVEKDRDHPYKTLNTSFALDERLSWGARGMLVYLLSKSDDWKVVVRDLIRQSPAGRDAVYAILKDLENHGYLKRMQSQRADGTFEWTTVVFESARPLTEKPEVEQIALETPENDADRPPLPASPDTVQPDTVQPYTEKPDIYLIEIVPKTDLPIKDLPSAAARARDPDPDEKKNGSTERKETAKEKIARMRKELQER